MNDSSDHPFDPTVLRVAATTAHELYTEFKHAGFSRTESLELVARVITAGLSAAGAGDTESGSGT